jgi:hypothetical protein
VLFPTRAARRGEAIRGLSKLHDVRLDAACLGTTIRVVKQLKKLLV